MTISTSGQTGQSLSGSMENLGSSENLTLLLYYLYLIHPNSQVIQKLSWFIKPWEAYIKLNVSIFCWQILISRFINSFLAALLNMALNIIAYLVKYKKEKNLNGNCIVHEFENKHKR